MILNISNGLVNSIPAVINPWLANESSYKLDKWMLQTVSVEHVITGKYIVSMLYIFSETNINAIRFHCKRKFNYSCKKLSIDNDRNACKCEYFLALSKMRK